MVNKVTVVVISTHFCPRDGKGKRVEFICSNYSFPMLAVKASLILVNAIRAAAKSTVPVSPLGSVIVACRDWFRLRKQ